MTIRDLFAKATDLGWSLAFYTVDLSGDHTVTFRCRAGSTLTGKGRTLQEALERLLDRPEIGIANDH